MEKINLFASDVWKTKILPEEYNKAEIIKSIEKNYKIDSNRKTVFQKSNLHHYYEDWDDEKFEKVNLEILSKKYGEILNSFFQKQKYYKKFIYKYSIINITVYGKNQFMEEHDHFFKDTSMNSFYSCVHYIKHKKENSPLTFVNPNPLSHFRDIFQNLINVVDVDDIDYSQYHHYWDINVEEDDFIMFPAHLKHFVGQNKVDDLRIAITINVDIKI